MVPERKKGHTAGAPALGHLLPGLPSAHLRMSKGHETLSKAHPGWLSHLASGWGRGAWPTQDTGPAIDPWPPLPRPLSPRSTCSPWWWSTSGVSGCLVTSTTGSTSSWPCEQCPRAPSGGSRPSRGHMVRGGEGNEEGPGIMNVARKHHLLPRD